MRMPGCTILLVLLFLTFACDSHQGAFEDTVPNFYTLTAEASPEEGGTIHPSGGEFLAGNGVLIEAQPAEGFVFENWEGDLTGNSNPEYIQFSTNRTVTANFSQRNFELNITNSGNGLVRETVVERSSSSVTIRLDAEAGEGWIFDRWEGDLSGSSNPETITIEEDEEKSVTAIFIEIGVEEYSLAINTEGEGTVDRNPDKSSYTDGENVTLTANATIGWIFKEWQGDLSGSNNPETITVDKDKQITAVFEVDLDYGINIGEVKLYIREMELGGARRTKDFKTKDFILNLPLDGTPFHITHVNIPAGYYDELELDIKKPSNSVTIDDPDFRDGSGRYSLVVNGTFNGVDFTFRSDEDFEIDVDFSPHLEISSGQTSVFAIDIDFKSWFMGRDGEFLDPDASRNANRINKNIEDSFSDFEDGF